MTNARCSKGSRRRYTGEILFIIHQVYGLWFKRILHEVDSVVSDLQVDCVLGATGLLRRV
jgi:tryptophan 2,3-dioxygenase